MRKLIAAAVVIAAFASTSASAEDLTSLARPTVRGGASSSQIYFVKIGRAHV